MSYPGLSSFLYLSFYTWLVCPVPQVGVTDDIGPVDLENSPRAVVNECLNTLS